VGSTLGEILAHLSEPGSDGSAPDPQGFRNLAQASTLSSESNDLFLIYDPTRTARVPESAHLDRPRFKNGAGIRVTGPRKVSSLALLSSGVQKRTFLRLPS
jgi:hypothetical protein